MGNAEFQLKRVIFQQHVNGRQYVNGHQSGNDKFTDNV